MIKIISNDFKPYDCYYNIIYYTVMFIII